MAAERSTPPSTTCRESTGPLFSSFPEESSQREQCSQHRPSCSDVERFAGAPPFGPLLFSGLFLHSKRILETTGTGHNHPQKARPTNRHAITTNTRDTTARGMTVPLASAPMGQRSTRSFHPKAESVPVCKPAAKPTAAKTSIAIGTITLSFLLPTRPPPQPQGEQR